MEPLCIRNDNPIRFFDADGNQSLDSRYSFNGSTAKAENLNPTAVKILNLIINKLGVDKLTITSTGRTPGDQARIMFENLENRKSSSYGAAGREVIALYHEMKNNGASDADIKSAMDSKITQVGPTNVSKHTSDPQKMNAIDFGINSLSNDIGSDKMNELKSIIEDLVTQGVIKRFLNPDNNSGEAAFHIEIINTDNNSSDGGSDKDKSFGNNGGTPNKDDKKGKPKLIDSPINNNTPSSNTQQSNVT